jgi:hypothetical protein
MPMMAGAVLFRRGSIFAKSVGSAVVALLAKRSGAIQAVYAPGSSLSLLSMI